MGQKQCKHHFWPMFCAVLAVCGFWRRSTVMSLGWELGVMGLVFQACCVIVK